MDNKIGFRRVMRRSKSAHELRGAPIHPALPTGVKSGLAPRNTVGIRRPLATTNVGPPAKRPAPAPAPPAKRPAPAPAPVSKRVPLHDYKTRFNNLLTKHQEMKTQFTETKEERDTLKTEVEELRDLKSRLEETTRSALDRAEAFESRGARLASEVEKLSNKLQRTADDAAHLREELTFTNNELQATKYTLDEATEQLAAREQLIAQHEEKIADQAQLVEDLQESTQKLHWERRNLHNKLQDLKGNIRVIFRVRPALTPGLEVATINFTDACTLELERFEPGATKRLTKNEFKFDRVFGPKSTQDDVWEEVSCLVQSALDGYNVCIFAYGQTGSGKTYTMEGASNAPGVIPRSCTMIFDSIKQMSKSGWSYTVHASFLEIYNEQLFDLLTPGRDPRELDIRMVDAKGSDVYVTNLAEKEVSSAMELLKLASRAQLNRQTAATANNERSSRSHSVARIRLVGRHAVQSLTLTSRICLVDLAGSESAKTTQRLQETKNINRSLSELGQVILALQQKQEHVPYRNSKLTRLLEPQLGGAAKALLIAAAAPYENCSHESLSTLRFATKVGHCSTANARRNLALAQPTMQPKEEA